MSQQAVEVVRGTFDLVGGQDLVSFVGELGPGGLRTLVENLYTDDIEIEWLASNPDALFYRGHDGAVRAITDWLDAWNAFQVETTEYIDAGDQVLVPNVQRARGKGSGAEVELRTTFVCTVRDGKIARIKEVKTMAEAREVAGLSE
jgi:ketosteroid isomerase-like protein